MGSDKKWIYLSYIALTMLSAWVLNKVLILTAGFARMRNPMVLGVMPASQVIAFGAMTVIAFFYFRKPKVDQFSTEVAQEVKKVTWPPRKATYLSTIVVVVCVLVMAVILGIYDWACAKAVGWVLGI